MRVSRLQLKALLLLVVVALVPIGLAMAVLLPGYGQTVRVNEEHYQLAVLKEAVSTIERHLTLPQHDAVAVALALSFASTTTDAEGQKAAQQAVQAVLGSRESLDAVRFEVPSAGINTVLHKHGAAASDLPVSTVALRREADQRGVAFKVTDLKRGIIVVPIAKPEGAPEGGAKGYVTAAVYLAPLSDDLKAVAQSRAMDDQSTGMVLVDADRRVVASFQAQGLEPGADASGLALWSMIPENIPRDRPVGAKSDYTQDGQAMIGSVQTIRNVGWALAMWRPEAVVLSEYHRMRSMLAMIGAGAVLLSLILGVLSARAITRPVLQMAAQAQRIGRRAWDELRPPSKRQDELGQLSQAMSQMAKDLQEGEEEIARQAKLRSDLSRFMSKELVEGIVEGEHSLELGGKRQAVTVMFADVVAFTPLAENRDPERVVGMLNELFTVLTEVVFRHEGMVDKFMGDCIMAVWGAPLSTDDHAARALAAAEDMMRFLEVGAQQWRDQYDVEVRLAIGVNSGQAIVGNIGSDKRMEYTVVGDIVNVAARLENIAAPNQVLVGESTYELTQDEFELRLLGARTLTGRKAEIEVYELETG